MKKLILFFVILCSSVLNSQVLMTKDSMKILPEKKDWCISIDATKLIKMANFDYTSNLQTISGKYFLENNIAIRVGLRLGLNSWSSTTWVTDKSKLLTSSGNAYPATVPLKENKWSRSSGAVGLSCGIEKRRGKSRLQGIYGAEVGIFFSSLKDKFTYANKLNATLGANAISVDAISDSISSPIFGSAKNIDKSPNIQGVTGYARVVERSSGVGFSILARAFIGAEYFVLPKLSLGGEFGWGPSISIYGRSKTTYESIGISTVPGASSVPTVKQTTFDGSFDRRFSFDNDNANSLLNAVSATLRVNLYF